MTGKTASAARRVGVVGLGAMGLGMAQSLRRAGHDLYVHDVRKEVASGFATAGGVACVSPAAVAQACDVLVGVVFSAEQNEQVLFGPQGAAASMRPGSVYIMASTVDPAWSRAMEQRLADQGLLYLDAPISGGEQRAAAGELTVIAAGTDAAFHQAEGILQAMASHVFRVGDQAGAGSTVKLVNQLLVSVHMAVAAEAMALAMRQGVRPQALYDVITQSFGNSVMFQQRTRHMIEGDYRSDSVLDILVKDLGLVLDTARGSGFPLPLAATAHQMFLHAHAAGHGREATAAVIKYFPGIDLAARP